MDDLFFTTYFSLIFFGIIVFSYIFIQFLKSKKIPFLPVIIFIYILWLALCFFFFSSAMGMIQGIRHNMFYITIDIMVTPYWDWDLIDELLENFYKILFIFFIIFLKFVFLKKLFIMIEIVRYFLIFTIIIICWFFLITIPLVLILWLFNLVIHIILKIYIMYFLSLSGEIGRRVWLKTVSFWVRVQVPR